MLADKERHEGDENTGYRPVAIVICQNTVLQALIEQVLYLLVKDLVIVGSLTSEQGSVEDQEEASLVISDTIETVESVNHLLCPKVLIKKGRSEKDASCISEDVNGLNIIEVTLPVRWGTFAKRLKNILSSASSVQDIRFAGYHFSGAHSLLTLEDTGEFKRLTEKERDMLLFFYKNRDRAVSREEILAHVWGYADTAETHTVETHIYRLRQKIEKDPARPEIVITDDEGYRVLF